MRAIPRYPASTPAQSFAQEIVAVHPDHGVRQQQASSQRQLRVSGTSLKSGIPTSVRSRGNARDCERSAAVWFKSHRRSQASRSQTQLTSTTDMTPDTTVPLACDSVQVCPAGWVTTVTP